MERAIELAGFFAAHGVWCVAEGETLIPVLAFQRDNGKQEFRRIEAGQLEDAVAEGKQWLANNPEHVSCAVLVYDARIPLSGGKTDCLVLEVRSYGPTANSVSIALPYRHAKLPGGFAVHRPKFVTRPNATPAFDIGEVFFRGVAQHDKGSAVWNAHLDESR
jgi:hypothetical protein